MKKNDVLISTWEFGKTKLYFRLEDLEEELRKKQFTEDEILFSRAFVEKYFDGLKKNGNWTIDPNSYVNLLNYQSMLFAKKSSKIAYISLLISTITLLITILSWLFI